MQQIHKKSSVQPSINVRGHLDYGDNRFGNCL